MRTLILILLWNWSFGQQYVATWTGKSSQFQVQRSTDSVHWTTVSTIKNGNTYTTSYGATYYWRVKLDSGYSNKVWVYAFVTLTNIKIRGQVINWTSHTETNLAYYTINSTVVMKHGGNYTITVPKSGSYAIIAHYKNGDIATLKNL